MAWTRWRGTSARLLAVLIAALACLIPVGGTRVEAGEIAEQSVEGFVLAPVVARAKVREVGMVVASRSLPPTYQARLALDVLGTIEGQAPKSVSTTYSTRDEDSIPAKGATVAIGLRLVGERWRITSLCTIVDDEDLDAVREVASRPVGLTKTDGRWGLTSPDGDFVVIEGAGENVPAGVSFTAEPILPAKIRRYRNPFGDGEFKITLSNTTDAPVTLPMLRQHEGAEAPAWDEALVFITGGNSQLIGQERDGESDRTSEPVTLAPGESISTRVNLLRLRDVNWPGGGRVGTTIGLADRASYAMFYYHARHHGPMRAKLVD